MPDPAAASRPSNDIELRIETGLGNRAVIGADTTIGPVPREFWVSINGEPPALAIRQLGASLRRLAEQSAARIGERLHHAEFAITKNPATVEARGAMHDCAECRAGVQRALRMLAENPDEDLFVGNLFWAGP